MFPDKWKIVKLGKICEIDHGYPFEGQYITDEQTEYILVTPTNFAIGGGFKSDKLRYYKGSIESNYVLEADDLIVTMTDLSKKGDTLGYAALIPSVRGNTFLHNQRIGKVKILSQSIDKKFLLAILCSNSYRKYILETATGSTVKHTSPNKILAYQIALPPLPEQKKIAEILGSVEESIASTQAVIDQTRKVKQGLLQQLLTKGIGHTKFKESAIGKIPEEWQITTLNNIVEKNGLQIGPFGSQLHASDYTEEGLPVVMPKDIVDGKIVADKIVRIPETIGVKLKRHQLKAGDIVFGRRGDIGRCGLVSKFEENWYCGTGCIRARLKKEVKPRYLIHYLRLPTTIQWLNDNAVGQTMLNLNTTIIGNLPLVLPTQEEQNKIAEIFEGFEQQIYNLNGELSALFTIKQGLMQDLLTGKVRVKQT